MSQYTYYTISALGVRVPQTIKRTLTSLQILQFIVGSIFAGIHLFISYTVPVATPYEIIENVVSQPISSASSVISSVTASAPLTMTTGAAVAFFKKLVYRAAGEEGLAENIPYSGNAAHLPHVPHAIHDRLQHGHNEPVKRTVYRNEYQTVPCIDTSGQAFAIYLNLIYLAPLTGLFMRFFIKSYIRRSASTKAMTKKDAISKFGRDAIREVDQEIESLGKAAEDTVDTGINYVKNSVRGRSLGPNNNRAGSLSPANQKFVESFNRKVSQRLEEMGDGAQATKERAKKIAKEVVSGARSPNSKGAKNQGSNNDRTRSPNGDASPSASSNANGSANGTSDVPPPATIIGNQVVDEHAYGTLDQTTEGQANGDPIRNANGNANAGAGGSVYDALGTDVEA